MPSAVRSCSPPWDGALTTAGAGRSAPPLDLIEVLRRLRGEAERVLVESGTERESREADAETDARFQLGLDACEQVLVDLDEREGERA